MHELPPASPMSGQMATVMAANEVNDDLPVEQWPSVSQAAQQIGVSEPTVRAWIRGGKARSQMFQGLYRVHPGDVLRLSQGTDGQNQGMMAAGEIMGAAGLMLREQLRHNEALHKGNQGTIDRTFDILARTNEHLHKEVERLMSDNAKLRAEAVEHQEGRQKLELQKEELALKKENGKRMFDLAEKGFPQLLALASSKLNPTDATATEKGIAAWLSGISQDQAMQLAAKGCLTGEQMSEAVAMRTEGAKPGQLARWFRSFTTEQLQKMATSAVLSKEQLTGLFAYHEAAGRLQLDGKAAGSDGAAALASVAAGALAGAAVGAATTAPTVAPTVAPDPNAVTITRQEAGAIAAFIGALFSCPEDVQVKVLSQLSPEDRQSLISLQL